MKNYEELLGNFGFNEDNNLPLMREYIQELKAQLLTADKQLMRELIDCKFVGGPQINTVISYHGGGKSALMSWIAANCYFLNDKDTVSYFSDMPANRPVELFKKMGGIAKCIISYTEKPSIEYLQTAIANSSLVIIDQPLDFTEICKMIKLISYSSNARHCRGILIGSQKMRSRAMRTDDVVQSQTAREEYEFSNLLLQANLQPSNGEAPSITTLKTRGCNTDKPTLYQLPQEILRLLNQDLK